jgi:hypothetical protein
MTEDVINHPKHYTSHPSGVEAITVCEHENFNLGCALKYLWRTSHKDGIQDLKKAVWYINREIDRLERINENQLELLVEDPTPTKGA